MMDIMYIVYSVDSPYLSLSPYAGMLTKNVFIYPTTHLLGDSMVLWIFYSFT